MNNQLLIIAHAPLASALKECALHVYPDCAEKIISIDVPANEAPEATLKRAQDLILESEADGLLVMTDVYGATPSNVAQKLVSGT